MSLLKSRQKVRVGVSGVVFVLLAASMLVSAPASGQTSAYDLLVSTSNDRSAPWPSTAGR